MSWPKDPRAPEPPTVCERLGHIMLWGDVACRVCGEPGDPE